MGRVLWHGSLLDAIANVALLMPLGLVLKTQRRSRKTIILTGACMSFGIEALQLFLTRVTSPSDFVLNILGIALIAAWRPRRIVPFRRALSLTVPLWALGLLWPYPNFVLGVVAAAALVVSGLLFLSGNTRASARAEVLVWLALSCAPLAANGPVPGVALMGAGAFCSVLLPRVLNDIKDAIPCLACPLAAVLLLIAGIPMAYPLDVWSGFSLILLVSLCSAPWVDRASLQYLRSL